MSATPRRRRCPPIVPGPRSKLRLGLGVCAALLLAACAPPPTAPAPTACGDAPRTGHAREDLVALVASCGPTTATTPIEVRENVKQNTPERFVFEVVNGARCYRVFAAGDAGIQTLAVRIRDENGRNLVESNVVRSFAVVPERSLLCLPDAGFYYVDVAVLAGEGSYAVQVRESD
jgi:hypothetical protein